MEIKPKLWRLCLSFHEAWGAACRWFSQAMNSKAPAHTCPTGANGSVHGTQSRDPAATHPHLELPSWVHGNMGPVGMLESIGVFWLPRKTDLQNSNWFSMFSWGSHSHTNSEISLNTGFLSASSLIYSLQRKEVDITFSTCSALERKNTFGKAHSCFSDRWGKNGNPRSEAKLKRYQVESQQHYRCLFGSNWFTS